MDESGAASPLDRLDKALERGVTDDVVGSLLPAAVNLASVHDVAEFAGFRLSWPRRIEALPFPALPVAGMEAFAMMTGTPSAGTPQRLASDGRAVWEIATEGSSDIVSIEHLLGFRDQVRRRASTNFADLLYAAFTELLSNAAEHGASTSRGIAAFVVGADLVSFSVTDIGRGVLETLRGNPAFSQVATGAEALSHAVQDGTTGTAEAGRGNGFNHLFRALADRQARLRFRSSTGAIGWAARGPDRHTIPRIVLPERRGFHVRLTVPVGA